MRKRETERTENISPLSKSLPYEAGKEDIQLNYIVENYIPDDKEINICDYGCGNGLFLAAISNHPKKSIGIYLPVDEDDDALMETGSHMLNNPQITSPLNVCKPDKLDVEKYGGNFDLIILHHVLHEVVRPHEMFEQIFKLLKPEGKILVGDFTHFWWYEPDHVFWDCDTVKDFFDSKKFDVNCISHKYKDKYGHFFAEVSLKKNVAFPKKSELLLRLKNIYEKMLKFYQDKINAITKKHPFKEKPQDVQILETLTLHVMLRLKDVEDEIERKTSRPSYLFNIAPPEPNFLGRVEMIDTITEWYKNPDIYIGALIGWGGEGKSAIVRKWFDSLEDNGIKPDGIFWWGFYRNPYLERFLDSLLEYFAASRIDLKEIKSTWAKVDKIKEFIVEGEYLIILDGLEEMQKGEESGELFGCVLYAEFSEILKFFADSKVNGLCLITSRYPLTDIKKWKDISYQIKEVERLSLEEGRALFEKAGIKGNQEEIDAVIEDYKGHALSLTLLATYLVEDHKGDIRKAKEIPPFYSDKEAGGKAHRILQCYGKQLTEAQLSFMKIFSLFRRAVYEDDFERVFRSEMESTINRVLKDMSKFLFIRMKDNLCDRRLISKGQDGNYATHPLIKGYFESIMDEDDKKVCQKKIYEYIGTYAPEKPGTLEEMQPLFEQVYHGCAAGLYNEVYEKIYQNKIQCRNEYYLVLKLGAWETDLDLVLNFFPLRDVSKMPLVSKRDEQINLIGEAGTALFCIGKPSQAEILLMRAIEMSIEDGDFKNASIAYRTLSENQLRIGEIIKAKEIANNAVEMAVKTHVPRQQVRSKAFLAYILFLLGETEIADMLFKGATVLQKGIDSDAGVLYSIEGIFYADFLTALGRNEEALEVSTQNLEICTNQKKLIAEVSRCLRSLGSLERIKGNYDKSYEHLNGALKIARKTGIPDLEIECLIEQGRLKLKTEDYNGAESDLKYVLKVCDRIGFKLYEPCAEVVLAKVYWVLGDIDRAKKFANSAYEKASEIHYHWPKVEAEELLKEIS